MKTIVSIDDDVVWSKSELNGRYLGGAIIGTVESFTNIIRRQDRCDPSGIHEIDGIDFQIVDGKLTISRHLVGSVENITRDGIAFESVRTPRPRPDHTQQ